MKKIITIFVAAALCLSSAFSKEGGKTSFKDLQKYVKGTIGFSHGLIYPDLEYSSSDETYAAALNQVSVGSIYYNGFEIIPTFGFDFPDADGKKIGFSLEGSLGFVFGGYSEGIYESKTTIVNPGVMGIMRITALDKFVPYFGAGFSVPIQIVSTKIKYSYGGYNSGNGYSTKGTTIEAEADDTVVSFKVNFLTGARYDFTDKVSALSEFAFGVGKGGNFSFRIGAMYRF